MKTESIRIQKQSSRFERLLEESGIPCEVQYASGEVQQFGSGRPAFFVKLHNDKLLHGNLSEFELGKAYVNGEFELEGDMLCALDFRQYLGQQTSWPVLFKFLNHLFLRSAGFVNRRSIAAHYNLGDDFYLSFIDNNYRFYSQCLFHSEDETLEQAAEHKLETIAEALDLKPGMRLLDIGAGWGGIQQYFGSRGVHVTSLTLAEDSHHYTKSLIDRMGLENCSVRVEDFLQHKPQQPYDAVVILGVIEHIPYYRKFCRQLWDCLMPGGLMYLDASASQQKYDISDFSRAYIWQGAHTFLCLQDLTQELLYHGMEVVEVKRESRDYELTMKHWASRFDAGKDKFVSGWGEDIYRIFRMYLWAGCHAFGENSLQAYHLVAQRHRDPGIRPGALRRSYDFVRSMV